MGARGTEVDQTDKISALMELNVHGKDGRWERQIRTSKVCTWLRALGRGVDWGPVGVSAAVKAVSVSELAQGEGQSELCRAEGGMPAFRGSRGRNTLKVNHGGVIRGGGGWKWATGRGFQRSFN